MTTDPPQTPDSLDADERAQLEAAGRAWEQAPSLDVSTATVFDPDLGARKRQGKLLGDSYVAMSRTEREGFERHSPGVLSATQRASNATTPLGRFRQRIRTAVIGSPIKSSHAVHERLSKFKALAVLSSDALS